MTKLSVRIESFTPRRSNTLVGFANIIIPELHLRILDLTIHQKNESRWIGFPGKAQIDREGMLRKDDRGKILYTPTLEFTNREVREAFSNRVIAALLEYAPAAFAQAERPA